MARYTEAVCRLCRRERMKLFLKGTKCDTTKCPIERRPYPPGDHGRSRRSQGSEYLTQLREKQKARRIYGIMEKQFRKGIAQLDEEGVVQVLRSPETGDQAPVLAAVGPMQFEVASWRLENEFGAPAEQTPTAYRVARRTDEASRAKLRAMRAAIEFVRVILPSTCFIILLSLMFSSSPTIKKP